MANLTPTTNLTTTAQLPMPSKEQQAIIDLLLNHENVIVNAVAGSGKTTLVLMLAEALKKLGRCNERILLITYSKSLKESNKAKTDFYHLSDRISCYTIHGLAKLVLDHKIINDDSLEQALKHKKDFRKKFWTESFLKNIKYIIIDECQDLKILFYLFLKKFIKLYSNKIGYSLTFMAVGDVKQTLYDPDAYHFLVDFDKYFQITCKRKDLSVNYRCDPNIIEFINNIYLNEQLLKYPEYKIYDHNKKRIKFYFHDDDNNVAINKIINFIDNKLKDKSISINDFVIANYSVSKDNKKDDINLLHKKLADHYDTYTVAKTNGDKNTYDVQEAFNKLEISSIKSLKGREKKFVILYNFDLQSFSNPIREEKHRSESEGNAQFLTKCSNLEYVALTRATDELFIIYRIIDTNKRNYYNFAKYLSNNFNKLKDYCISNIEEVEQFLNNNMYKFHTFLEEWSVPKQEVNVSENIETIIGENNKLKLQNQVNILKKQSEHNSYPILDIKEVLDQVVTDKAKNEEWKYEVAILQSTFILFEYYFNHNDIIEDITNLKRHMYNIALLLNDSIVPKENNEKNNKFRSFINKDLQKILTKYKEHFYTHLTNEQKCRFLACYLVEYENQPNSLLQFASYNFIKDDTKYKKYQQSLNNLFNAYNLHKSNNIKIETPCDFTTYYNNLSFSSVFDYQIYPITFFNVLKDDNRQYKQRDIVFKGRIDWLTDDNLYEFKYIENKENNKYSEIKAYLQVCLYLYSINSFITFKNKEIKRLKQHIGLFLDKYKVKTLGMDDWATKLIKFYKQHNNNYVCNFIAKYSSRLSPTMIEDVCHHTCKHLSSYLLVYLIIEYLDVCNNDKQHSFKNLTKSWWYNLFFYKMHQISQKINLSNDLFDLNNNNFKDSLMRSEALIKMFDNAKKQWNNNEKLKKVITDQLQIINQQLFWAIKPNVYQHAYLINYKYGTIDTIPYNEHICKQIINILNDDIYENIWEIQGRSLYNKMYSMNKDYKILDENELQDIKNRLHQKDITDIKLKQNASNVMSM